MTSTLPQRVTLAWERLLQQTTLQRGGKIKWKTARRGLARKQGKKKWPAGLGALSVREEEEKKQAFRVGLSRGPRVGANSNHQIRDDVHGGKEREVGLRETVEKKNLGRSCGEGKGTRPVGLGLLCA